jgi:4-amino-4-deoxy-L-arabinose transferase-like glycosyltransferase
MRAALTVPRRELRWLLCAIAVGLLVRVVFIVLTRHAPLRGDEIEYDEDGGLLAHGRWFWSIAPYGVAHASAWKAPGYVLWVGVWYALVGDHPVRLELVQALLCGPASIWLTYVLGRRLFGARVGLAAAFVFALYPFAWQYEVRLYSESIATPLTVLALILVLEREASVRRAAAAGALLGAILLIRPTSLYLLPGFAVCWLLASGWRRGLTLSIVSAACVVLVIAPWTIRNHEVVGGWIPISVQDAAAYGTFNATSAHDPVWPYAWRPVPPGYADMFDLRHPYSDVRWRTIMDDRARKYVSAHPTSVLGAFFWNGLSRLWGVRRPARELTDARFTGRDRGVTVIGLFMYWVLAPLALVALWRLRRSRRGLVLPLVAIAVSASLVFTIAAETRYRAPFEPVIVVLACATVLGAARSGSVRSIDEHMFDGADRSAHPPR